MRQVILTLALLAVVLVGCEKKQEVDSGEILYTPWYTLGEVNIDSAETTETYITIHYTFNQPDPCPPCPDTASDNWLIRFHRYAMDATFQVKLDTFLAICDRARGEASFWKYAPDTVYQMPPGRWVTTRQVCAWCETGRPNMDWPDSVFVPTRRLPGEE